MHTSFRTVTLLGAIATTVLGVAPMAGAIQTDSAFTNLQVLPADIAERDLIDAMLENLRGLGLPRRQNEGCLHCHVGDMEQPVATWDFASDAKPAKHKARVMMAMVAAINRDHLSRLDARIDPPQAVTCYTCHAGRPDPRPLPDVLTAAYRRGGIDSVIGRYRELRERYFGADAYDFRVGVLNGLSGQLAASGAYDDALALAELNTEAYPDDRRAWGNLVVLRLARAGRTDVTDALTEYDRIKSSADSVHLSPAILDALGWPLYRMGRQTDAVILFRRNLAEYPDQYIPNESLADALFFLGEREEAIRLFEAWLERHPDHAMARRRLTNILEQH